VSASAASEDFALPQSPEKIEADCSPYEPEANRALLDSAYVEHLPLNAAWAKALEASGILKTIKQHSTDDILSTTRKVPAEREGSFQKESWKGVELFSRG